MRGLLLILCVFVSILHGVAAVGGRTITAQDDRFRIDQYPSFLKQEFGRRFRQHVNDELGLSHVQVGNLEDGHITVDQLTSHLLADQHQRRLIYLGHTEHHLPDMVLASPLVGAHPDGSKVFGIYSAHKTRTRPGHASLKAYGFVKVKHADALMHHMDASLGPQGGALEKGHVLKLGEMLEELPMLYPPNWAGRVPRG